MIAGKARATKLLLLVAIALAVLAYLVVRAAEAPRTPVLPHPPLHTRNYLPSDHSLTVLGIAPLPPPSGA